MLTGKKTISIILTVMMLFAFAPPAFASAGDTAANGIPVEEQEPAGTDAGNDQGAMEGAQEGEPSHNIADYTFTLSQDKFFYDGQPQKPDVICEGLPADAYNVEYQIDQGDWYDEGVYEVYISGNENAGYFGNVTLSYQIVLTTIDLNKYSATLYRKGTLQLNATVQEPDGNTTWTSSNTKVATVSSTGIVTAKAEGTATIKVANGNAWETAKITVRNPALNASAVKLYVKGAKPLKVTGKIGKATFKTSNKKIATVSAGGKITAKKKGTCTITVKSNGITMKCKVTVKNPYINKKSVTLVKGKTAQLKVIGKIGKATFKTSNKKIATVSSSGKIKAKKKGKCTITVKSNGITMKCKVKVKNPPPVYVYVTRTGKRYHCDPDCWGLRNARAIWKVTLTKAKKRKLTPCHVCY